tara:strand:+ start:5340 stop:6341 length:1002 start_codon:yes stop_codon:yes gene_type:complete
MAEESKLIEDAVSSTGETTQGFDPSSFLGEQPTLVEATEEVTENVEATEVAETEEVEESDDFSWESVETQEPVSEVEEEVVSEKTEAEEESDWDESEEVEAVAAPELDWSELSKEAGIEAGSKEEFLNKVKEALKPQVKENEVIENLNSYLELSDKDLVVADMRASKYEDEAIEDTVDRLTDAGLLKREATLIRQQLNKHIHNEKDRLRTEKQQGEKQKEEASVKSRKDLQSFIKQKEEFFGGKVSQKEKKRLYSYITKGNFAQDIFESHANVAEAAFLWQNKDKIFKMVRTQGVELGKSKVLDGITSPSRGGRSTKSFEPVKKGFDPSKFIG